MLESKSKSLTGTVAIIVLHPVAVLAQFSQAPLQLIDGQ